MVEVAEAVEGEVKVASRILTPQRFDSCLTIRIQICFVLWITNPLFYVFKRFGSWIWFIDWFSQDALDSWKQAESFENCMELWICMYYTKRIFPSPDSWTFIWYESGICIIKYKSSLFGVRICDHESTGTWISDLDSHILSFHTVSQYPIQRQ
jgi:hypothetical protein